MQEPGGPFMLRLLPGPRERVYDQEIRPLLDQIAGICRAHCIDHLMYFALDADVAGDHVIGAGMTYIEREGLPHMRLAHLLLSGDLEPGEEQDEPSWLPWGDA